MRGKFPDREPRLVLTHHSQVIGACHQGAALEGLCPTDDTPGSQPQPYTTFYHNVSSYSGQLPNADDTQGMLYWTLHANNGALIVPSAMRFWINPTSNVAIMMFAPGDSQYNLVSFEAGSGAMYIPLRHDENTGQSIDPPIKLKNWYMCKSAYSARLITMVWRIGTKGEPDDPTCYRVDVKRVWN